MEVFRRQTWPGSDRAAELAKCDLVTGMVGEFPELQGIVGGLYARAQGEPEDIAWAVYDHYQPAGLDDPLPRNLTGCAVALADKLDSLVACFAVGAVPTGSSDPFALRRAALGIVKIILEKKLPLSLSAAISAAAKALTRTNAKNRSFRGGHRSRCSISCSNARATFCGNGADSRLTRSTPRLPRERTTWWMRRTGWQQ